MKKINFFLALAVLFVLTACNNTDSSTQANTENPVMEMQEEMKKSAVKMEQPAVDATATANQPTAEAAKEMMDDGEKVAKMDMAKKQKKASATPPKATQVKQTSKPMADKKVMPAAKVEKPAPMTTEVEQKVKVMANAAETQVAENTSNTSAASQATTTPPRPTAAAETAMVKEEKMEEEAVVAKPDHSLWNSILQKNVSSNGKVNYAGIKAQKAQLEKYLTDLESNPPQADWSRNEKLAYWINVYNAYTVKLIVDNYPVKSITNLEGGKPWDKKWINIDGKSYSLNNIENDLIRPRFKEPRIHFAVNCAAQSCPPILNKAWTADNLNRYFNQQAKSFINNSKYNQISANSVTVSKIFDWYGEDFGNLINYLNKYSDTKISSDATVNFKEYDWNLNN